MQDATPVSAIDTATSSVQSSLASQTQSVAAGAHNAPAGLPAPPAAGLTTSTEDLAGQVASLANASANTTSVLQAIMDRLDTSTLRAEATAADAAREATRVADKAEYAREAESERLAIW
jgi:hypothetical protein